MPGLSTLRVVGGGQEEEEEEEEGGDKKKGGRWRENKERTEREKVDGTDYGATHDQIGPAAHTRPERQEEEAAVASVYSSLSLCVHRPCLRSRCLLQQQRGQHVGTD